MTAYETFDPYPLKVRFGPVPVRTWNDHNLNDEYSPQPTPFFSGHFVFSAGEFVKEVRQSEERRMAGRRARPKRQLVLHLAGGAQRQQHIATYIQEKKLELVAKLLSMLRI